MPGYQDRPRPGRCGLYWRLEGDCDAGDTSTILAGHFTPSYTVTQDTQYGHLSKTQISINGPAEAWSMGVAQMLIAQWITSLCTATGSPHPGTWCQSTLCLCNTMRSMSHEPTHPVTASINPGKGQPRRQSHLELQTKLHKV